MKIKFELPKESRKEEALLYVQEHHKFNSDINGSGGLHKTDNFSSWVKQKTFEHLGNIDSDMGVPRSTYFVTDESNRIIGMANIRQYLNEALLEEGWGHIGYSVRPTERRKGYATEILRLALIKCKELGLKEVLVGCVNSNTGSRKVILKNGGVFLKEYSFDDEETESIFKIKT